MRSEGDRKVLRVGLVGDRNPQVRAHVAIPKALEFAGGGVGCKVETAWIATNSLDDEVGRHLSSFDALWCVPASPYASMEGALHAIRPARERRVPFLGTCGGFQHALIEYARNVHGYSKADHAETNPGADMALVAPLSCSLVGAKGRIRFSEGSRVSRIYGIEETVEEYHCNFGFNPRYFQLLESGEMKVVGVDEDDEVRVVEHSNHPFFVATLFQPELSALAGSTHPLICAFMSAAKDMTA